MGSRRFKGHRLGGTGTAASGMMKDVMVAQGRFRSLFIRNLLSFGSEGAHLELQPLNVLIGPNASGKSNLIEAVSLLQAAPNDLPRPTRRDGIAEWLWK